MRAHWMKSTKESMRLEEAGLTGDVLDSALSSFILEVVAKHGEPAPRLCNKDPFTLKSGAYLKQLFPKSKFLFMVRGKKTFNLLVFYFSLLIKRLDHTWIVTGSCCKKFRFSFYHRLLAEVICSNESLSSLFITIFNNQLIS